jgi:WD40 repeat protein
MDYSPKGDTFSIGGDDKCLKIYDDNMKIITTKFAPGGQFKLGHESRINSIAYNKDVNNSNMIISAGWDRNIMIYDLRESICIYFLFNF